MCVVPGLSEPQLPNLEYRAVLTFRDVSHPWVNSNSVWEALTPNLFIYTALHMLLSAFEFEETTARGGLELKLRHPQQWFSK